MFHYRDLELATDHFSDHKLLVRGSQNLVYKALLPCGRLVAVKKPSLRRAPSSEFDNELLIISHLRSPRFVNLFGYSSDRRLMVVEYMSNDTLYGVFHKSPKPLIEAVEDLEGYGKPLIIDASKKLRGRDCSSGGSWCPCKSCNE